MALNTANCLKIETAGLLIGWTYFIAFVLGFLAILTASLIGIFIYIAGLRKICAGCAGCDLLKLKNLKINGLIEFEIYKLKL